MKAVPLYCHLLCLASGLQFVSFAADSGPLILSADSLGNDRRFFLGAPWKYHAGDNPEWESPSFDDGLWQEADTRLEPEHRLPEEWKGIGWFRLHLVVDSTLWYRPLALWIAQAGSMRVYLDGVLIHSSGNDGRNVPDDVTDTYTSVPTFSFGDSENHILAVRYANYATESFHDVGLIAGFALYIGRADAIIAQEQGRESTLRIIQIFLTTVALSFAVLHVILFLFSPQTKSNLYFAIFVVLFAGNLFFDYQANLAQDIRHSLSVLRIHRGIISINSAFILLFLYSVFEFGLPKRFWIIAIAMIAAGVLAVYNPVGNLVFAQGVGILAALEAVRVMYGAIRRKRDGAWIIATGFILLFLFSSYDTLLDLEWMDPIREINNGYPAGFLCLIVSMSVYLARDSARRNHQLLVQELQAKEHEIQRRLLSADNDRKTKELEDARQVQLSMLPNEVPALPHLEIAAFMKTATEVGGDYYDFHLTPDGTLTVAVGDATGHGARAGTMVTIAKSLFHQLAGIEDLREIFERYTHGIKLLNLDQLYMAMTLVRIKDHTLVASVAGMPPIVVFRAGTKTVEEVVLKGMPLGCFSQFPYQQAEVRLFPGDTVVLMSDGLSEMFNPQKETMDVSRAKQIIREVGHMLPQTIIERLSQAAEEWANGRPQDDDVTLVVLQVKQP